MGSDYPAERRRRAKVAAIWPERLLTRPRALGTGLGFSTSGPLHAVLPEAVMANVNLASPGVAVAPTRGSTRGRDRRIGLSALLATLAEHVRAGRDHRVLRAEFEAALRHVLRLKVVRLREHGPPYLASGAASGAVKVETPGGKNVCLNLRIRDGIRRKMFEA